MANTTKNEKTEKDQDKDVIPVEKNETVEKTVVDVGKNEKTVEPVVTQVVGDPDVDGTPEFKDGHKASKEEGHTAPVLESSPDARVSPEVQDKAPHAFHQTLTSAQSLSGQPPNLADNAPFQVLDPH